MGTIDLPNLEGPPTYDSSTSHRLSNLLTPQACGQSCGKHQTSFTATASQLLPDQPTPGITLLRLETLILDSYTLRATGFIDTFVVPALRTLHVTEDVLGASPIGTLASFISKSGCSLQEPRFGITPFLFGASRTSVTVCEYKGATSRTIQYPSRRRRGAHSVGCSL
ncbi:hypothetical protein B0H13DRAFT_2276578 [Mycena leptocephala]|nr:hypothetical protein B0H13DRAFT_2276578 [Mycena leptocephala]